MDIKTALEKATKKIEKKQAGSAALEAEALLAFVSGRGREFLHAYPEKKITFRQRLKLWLLAVRRANGFPVAYLTGHKEFYGSDFLVDKNVLVPRPETELMVDEALRIITNYKLKNVNLIDVGTGSGCVIISLAKKLEERGIEGNFYALDISPKALAVAKKNAEKNQVSGRIKFLRGDLLSGVEEKIFGQPAIITANLPYLTPEQVKNSPTIRKEPKIALLAGEDGLDAYRRLFYQIKGRKLDAKNRLTILCEIDDSQPAAIKELAEKNFPEAKTRIEKDWGGYDRLAVISLRPPL